MQFAPRLARLACAVLAALPALVGMGQDDFAKSWRLLEADREMLDYRAELREGLFGEPSKAFLERTALPQLALPANRGTIDRVRRRMRETLCGDVGGDRKAAESAMRVVIDFMTRLARDQQADMVVRVNAMLLVGELRSADQKPWPPAAAVLAEALGDDRLPAAVRIAAAAGLDRHVEASGKGVAPTAGPVLVGVLEKPAAAVDPAAATWLAARCLEMLGSLGPAAPPQAAAVAAKILAAATSPLDLRVRAAAALGRMASSAAGLDFAGTTEVVRATARATLEADRDEAERWRQRRRLERPAANAAPQVLGDGSGEPFPALLPLSCRRTAWRLATLADALLSADGTSGIGLAAGADRQSAAELAALLRRAAADIDANPDETSIEAALATLADAPAPAAAPPAPASEQPAEPAAESPFASPFGN